MIKSLAMVIYQSYAVWHKAVAFNFMYTILGVSLFLNLNKREQILGEKNVLAAVLIAAASTASAGGMMEPVMETPVIMEEAAAGSSSGMLMPLLLLAVVVAVAS